MTVLSRLVRLIMYLGLFSAVISDSTFWHLLQVHLEQMPKSTLGYHQGEKPKRVSVSCHRYPRTLFLHLRTCFLHAISARTFRTLFSHAISARNFHTLISHAIFACNFRTLFSHVFSVRLFARYFRTQFSHAISVRYFRSFFASGCFALIFGANILR